MRRNTVFVVTFVAALAAGALADGQEPGTAGLPAGAGLSAKYPGDQGIGKDPAVVFSEDFESGSIEDVQKRWTLANDTQGHSLSDQVPSASSGRRSYSMTCIIDKQPGGYLYKLFKEGLDTAYLRYYVKFAPDHAYQHHSVCLGGYNPPLRWPAPRAGSRPAGNDRVLVVMDPVGWYGKYPPMGVWTLYTYWCDMKVSADGHYWGNCIQPASDVLCPRGKWICVETMVRLNHPSKGDGALALWIDGKPVLSVNEGTRRGPWSGMGFKVAGDDGDPLGGLRLRTDAALKINHLWLQHDVSMGAQTMNKVEKPHIEGNTVWFDDIVVAKEYIGPVVPLEGEAREHESR
jgi:hypothetical protein